MKSLLSPFSFLTISSPMIQFPVNLQMQPPKICCKNYHHHLYSSQPFYFPVITYNPLCARQSSIGCASISPNEGTVEVINFEDFIEKDWSFLDTDNSFSTINDYKQRVHRIISAGKIQENSRVMVSVGSEEFVDQLIESSPSCDLLLLVHDSLLILACIKEKYDKVKCWQGEIIHLPEKWTPFDVVLLYFLPALPFKLDQVFAALAERCLPGARLVISHPQGREILNKQREQYADVIISDLPEKSILEKVSSDHSFELVEFVDDTDFYLAVLKFSK